MLINLEDLRPSGPPPPRFALFELGFRIFFVLAGLHAVIAVGLWTLAFFGRWSPPVAGITLPQWHAHEMIYGFSLAVIAGFLLTASGNWTGRRTLHGGPLAGLAALWLAARVAFSSGHVVAAGWIEAVFIAALTVAVTVPLVRARQRRQTGIVAKLVLFLPAALVFTLGAGGQWSQGAAFGVVGGLYLVIGLVLMMGRRVVPVFIKSGVPEPFEPRNSRLVDAASLAVFLVFFVAVLWPAGSAVASGVVAWSALALFVLNAVRLAGWHTPGIWRRPLVWVLFVGMGFVTLGFGLLFLAHLGRVPPFVATHAFAYGGIGLMTLGMMARVSLGHTGRSIHEPPGATGIAFAILTAGALARVVAPVFWPGLYATWIGASQGLWMLAFAIFIIVYGPMLVRPRLDGRRG